MKTYNSLLSFNKVTLYLLTFYYTLHITYPEISRKDLYILLFIITILNIIRQPINLNTKININYIVLLIMFIGNLLILFFSVNIIQGEQDRFNTSVSLYLGILVFITFFYSTIRYKDYNWKIPVKVLFWIILLSVYVEFLFINFLKKGGAEFIPYYTSEYKRLVLDNFLILGYSHAQGLLGMRHMTSSFLVALFCLAGFFCRKKSIMNYKFFLLLIALLMSFSGSSMILLFLVILFYLPLKFKFFFLSIFILMMTLVENTGWFSKISYEYIVIVFDIKIQQIKDIINIFIDDPFSFFIGTHIQISSDFSILKALADIGVFPLILNIAVLITIIRQGYRILPYDESTNVSLALCIIFISTFHYPLLFSVPVQALLAYLYIVFMKVSKIKNHDNYSSTTLHLR